MSKSSSDNKNQHATLLESVPLLEKNYIRTQLVFVLKNLVRSSPEHEIFHLAASRLCELDICLN